MPCQFQEAMWTLQKTPKYLKTGISYPIQISHWAGPVDGLRNSLEIKKDKDAPSILIIKAKNPNRFLAAQIANGLMQEYRHYLKQDYQSVAQEQLSYLKDKQTELFSEMDGLLTEHIEYSSQGLKKDGILSFDKENSVLFHPYYEMQAKLLSIEVDLRKLDRIETEHQEFLTLDTGISSSLLRKLQLEVQQFKHQKDLIALSFLEMEPLYFENRDEKLDEIRTKRIKVQTALKEIELGKQISCLEGSSFPPDWVTVFPPEEQNKSLPFSLQNYERLLSIQEQTLQDQLFSSIKAPKELEGIDLDSSRRLFLEYNALLDTAQKSLRHYQRVQEELLGDTTQITSLGSILRDAFSQKIIAEASNLEVLLKDKEHRSEKEAKRWEKELLFQTSVLKDHLKQLCIVEEINIDVIREKMKGLQKVTLDGVNQKLAILHEEIKEQLKQIKLSLELQRDLTFEKVTEMRETFAGMLPDKWRFEHWLEMKTAMLQKMMETVTGVVESKTMSSRLHHVASKALDPALIPSVPKSPHLFVFTCLGGFAFALLGFSFYLIRALFEGFPLNLQKLKALELPVIDSLTSFADEKTANALSPFDLEVLRKVAFFNKDAQVIGLIQGKGPDYSFSLLENLAKKGTRSILLRCDFLSSFKEDESPGILQIWEKKIHHVPIINGQGFDYLYAGGYSSFGAEILQSLELKNLIEVFKSQYDQIFLLTRSSLSSAESEIALSLCDKAVISVSKEKIQELTPFIDWGYDSSSCRITLITYS